MGTPDKIFKDYFKQPHVVASVAEMVLFNRNQCIDENDVSILDSVQTKIDRTGNRHKELIRDVHSRIFLRENNINCAIHFNLELMAYLDTAMVVRTMEYDINTLIVQIRRIASRMERTGQVENAETVNFLTQLPHVLQLEPCITCVVNLSKQKWDGYFSCDDLYHPRLKAEDIHPTTSGNLLVIDPHTMSDEQLELLIPELKLLFLIVRYQTQEHAQQLRELLENSELRIGKEMARVISTILNRKIKIPKKGETVIVCEAMRVITENIKAEVRSEVKDEAKAEGIQIGKVEGIQIGKVEGIRIGRFEIVAELYRDHTLSAEKAAAKLNMPVEQFLARTRMKMC